MGSLVLEKTLPLKKAVISFWFRIPKETAEAASGIVNFNDFSIFNGVVPLLVFGRQPTGSVYDINTTVIGHYYGYDLAGNPSYEFPVYGSEAAGPREAPMQPTCIGVLFVDDASRGRIDVHLQTADHGSARNTQQITTGWVPIINMEGVPIGIESHITADASYVTTAAPESLGNSADIRYDADGIILNGPNIKYDEWHHILISWNLEGGSSSRGSHDPHANPIEYVYAYSLMWCAIDGVNRAGDELPALTVASLNSPYTGEGITDFNPNAILCWNAYHIAGSYSGGAPNPVASFDVTFSSNLGDSVIIPSEVAYNTSPGSGDNPGTQQPSPVEPLRRIELAELQIFTDVTIDTGVEANRRAFIDYKRNEHGNPIPDKDGKLTLKPVNPKVAQDLLGKRPDILLHGTNRWKEGKNTGSLGTNNDGEEISSGQFAKTGTIVKYTPDPSVEPAA